MKHPPIELLCPAALAAAVLLAAMATEAAAQNSSLLAIPAERGMLTPSRYSWTHEAPLEEKQELLTTLEVRQRLEQLSAILNREIELLELGQKIQSQVQDELSKNQKDFYLRQQMRAIQKELGEKDEFKNEVDELEARLRKKKMSKEANERVKKEIKKLRMMSPMSAEATVVRNYIDWILSLPWTSSFFAGATRVRRSRS